MPQTAERVYQSMWKRSIEQLLICKGDKIVDVSDGFLAFAGYDRSYFVENARWSDFFPGQEQNYSPTGKAMTLKKLDGNMVEVYAFCRSVSDELAGYSFKPITRTHSSQIKNLFQSAYTAIIVTNLVEFLDCNEVAIKMFGCHSREELLGLHPMEFNPKFQPNGQLSMEQARINLERALHEGSLFFDWQFKRPNGESWEAEAHLIPFTLPNGDRVFQFCLRDVSAQKAAQREIEQQSERLAKQRDLIASIINSTADFVVAVDRDKIITHINHSATESLKLMTANVGVGEHINNMIHATSPSERWETIYKMWDDALLGKATRFETYYWVEEWKQRVDFEIQYNPIFSAGQEVMGAVIIGKDIRERKRYELEIQAQNEEMQQHQASLQETLEQLEKAVALSNRQRGQIEAVINSSQEAIIAIDANMNVTHLNGAAREMAAKFQVNWSYDQPIQNLLSDKFWGIFGQYWQRTLAGERFVTVLDYYDERLKEDAHQELSYNPIFDIDNHVIGGVVYCRDITTRRQQEQAIALQNRRLLDKTRLIQTIINSSEDVVIAVDAEKKITHFNLKAKELLSMVGMKINTGVYILDLVEPKHLEEVTGYWNRVFAGEKFTVQVTYWSEYLDAYSYQELRYSPLFNDNGEINGGVVFNRNITETKKYEVEIQQKNELLELQQEELREHIESLTQAQIEIEEQRRKAAMERDGIQSMIDNISDSIIAVDHQYNITHFNAVTRETVERNGYQIRVGSYYPDVIPAQKWEEARPFWELALNGEHKSFNLCFDFEQKGQIHTRHYWISYNPIRNGAGDIIGALGLTRDITELQELQLELAAKNEILQSKNVELEARHFQIQLQKDRMMKTLVENRLANEDLTARNLELAESKARLQTMFDEMEAMQTELSYRERYFNSIFEQSRDAIFLLSQGRYLDCNTAALRLFGCDEKSQFLGKSTVDFSPEFQPDGQLTATLVDYNTAQTRQNSLQIFEWLHIRPNGELWYAEVTESVFILNDEPLTLCIVRDVTERKRNEILIQEKNAILNAQEARLRQIIVDLEAARSQANDQRNQIRAIFNSVRDPLMAIDLDYTILHLNPQAEAFLSRRGRPTVKSGDNLKTYLAGVLSPEDLPVACSFWERGFSGETYSQISSSQNDAGEIVSHYIISYTPIYNEKNEVTGVVSIVQDITELKKRELELAEKNRLLEEQEVKSLLNIEILSATQEEMRKAKHEAELQRNQISAIINSTDDFIYAYDKDYRLIHFNDATKKLWEMQGVELELNIPVHQRVKLDDWKALKEMIDPALEGEKVNYEIKFIIADAPKFYALSYSPIYDEKRKVTGAVGYAKDITIRKKHEMELQQKNEEMLAQQEELRSNLDQTEELNRILTQAQNELNLTLSQLKEAQSQLVHAEKMSSLGQLTAGIAHEINNPITFIAGGVSALSKNIDDVERVLSAYETITVENVATQLKQIEHIKENLEFDVVMHELQSLLNNIVRGAERTVEIVDGLRTFSRVDEDDLKQFDVHPGIESTLVLLRNKYKSHITVERDYQDLPIIEGYPGKLNQVFMNLIVNAIQAIPETGVITISTRCVSNEWIEIRVTDTGVGMTEEVQRRIYDPFFTTKQVGEGTGLGMAITHSIVEKHNGKIRVISKPGEGATFILQLPVRQK